MKSYDGTSLSLENISLVNGAIENPQNKDVAIEVPTALQFGFGFEKKLNVVHERILINFQSEIKCVDSNNVFMGIQALFTIQFLFHIEGLKEYIELKEKEKVYDIDPSLHASTLSIAYSTARGIIFNRCLGTVMGNVILPVLDLKSLIDIANGTPAEPKKDSSKAPLKKSSKRSIKKLKEIKKG